MRSPHHVILAVNLSWGGMIVLTLLAALIEAL
jgi:hypothetical protein